MVFIAPYHNNTKLDQKDFERITKWAGRTNNHSRDAANNMPNITPLSTLYNSLILKGLKFNNFLAKNCKPSIYRALEKRVESQVNIVN